MSRQGGRLWLEDWRDKAVVETRRPWVWRRRQRRAFDRARPLVGARVEGLHRWTSGGGNVEKDDHV